MPKKESGRTYSPNWGGYREGGGVKAGTKRGKYNLSGKYSSGKERKTKDPSIRRQSWNCRMDPTVVACIRELNNQMPTKGHTKFLERLVAEWDGSELYDPERFQKKISGSGQRIQYGTSLYPNVKATIKAQPNASAFVETLVKNSDEYREFLVNFFLDNHD